jgi:hypothetical protein
MKIRILVFLLIGLIAGCSSSNQSDTSNRADWINNWLSNPVCTPPCFENIIPGETSIDGAYQVILRDRSNTDVRLDELTGNSENQVLLYWTKLDPEGLPYYPGAIYSINNSQRLVDRISLRLYSGEEYTTVNLDNIISKYGDPQYFISYHEKSYCVNGVVFSDYGMVAVIGLAQISSKVNLKGTDEIDYLDFFPIVDMEKKNFGFYEEINDIIPWSGYGEYLCK